MQTSQLTQIFNSQHQASRQQNIFTLEQRQQFLKKLLQVVLKYRHALAEAIAADFGHRSANETDILELVPALENIRYTLKKLPKWVAPQKRETSILFMGTRTQLIPQPRGVIGIIVPWNYPIYLALGPLIGALAAGNRAMIKMSEYTPKTGELLQQILSEIFPTEIVSVINGGVDIAKAFSKLAFDHLLFTGSTQIGKQIMQAASENLTPVTLELGGKSPAIIGPDAHWKSAVERIMMGKLLNAGQTCVAPDYVLLPTGKESQFVEIAKQIVNHHYPDLLNNPDYTHIINQSQWERLRNYLREAEEQGANVIPLATSLKTNSQLQRKIPPTLILNPASHLQLMQHEIFGPILPVISYQSLDEAINYVNSRSIPLALYYFGKNNDLIQSVIQKTRAGGVSINDTLLHVAQDDLPFGGVGASGMGQYHGYEGFMTFSHLKPIFYQSRYSTFSWLYPPYKKLIKLAMRWMLRK